MVFDFKNVNGYGREDLKSFPRGLNQFGCGFSGLVGSPPPCHHVHQVHGTEICLASEGTSFESQHRPKGDGIYTFTPMQTIAVKTADCLPILLTDQKTFVMALHGGWRGLAAGITVNAFAMIQEKSIPVQNIVMMLGPAIGAKNYEVGDEVVSHFEGSPLQLKPDELNLCLSKSSRGQWQIDLSLVATVHALKHGFLPSNLHVIKSCTFEDSDLWPSYRRERPHRVSIWSWIRL
jgi:YfiH family protein